MSRSLLNPLRQASSASRVYRPAPLRRIGAAAANYTALRHFSTENIPSSTPSRPCPSCQTPLPLTTTPCPSCSTLLPIPSGLTHHSILGLSSPIPAPPAFSTPFDLPLELSRLPAHGYTLDVKDLRNRMLQSQTQLHPDRYSSQGERVTSLARELSGRVNEAYGILADPLKRAEYILGAHAQATEETDSITDPMLLAEILEAREELESATTEEEVSAIREANHAKVEATIAALTEAFSADPPNLTEAKNLAVQLKYWQGLENAAKEWNGPN